MLSLSDFIKVMVTVIGTLSVCVLAIMVACSVSHAKPQPQCKSSVTGEFVSAKYAKRHPRTTQCAERK